MPIPKDLPKALGLLLKFGGESLPQTVGNLEASFRGASKRSVPRLLRQHALSEDILVAGLLIKRAAGRINEIIHTLGILLTLPRILSVGEHVESLSLAAASRRGGFDLETSKRIAEFTFIQWQGADARRQNKVFKDFYFLAEAKSTKIRELYVLGTEHVLRFFNSKRALGPILAGDAKLGEPFRARYGNRFGVVREYYDAKRDVVQVRDVSPYLRFDETLQATKMRL